MLKVQTRVCVRRDAGSILIWKDYQANDAVPHFLSEQAADHHISRNARHLSKKSGDYRVVRAETPEGE